MSPAVLFLYMGVTKRYNNNNKAEKDFYYYNLLNKVPSYLHVYLQIEWTGNLPLTVLILLIHFLVKTWERQSQVSVLPGSSELSLG